MWCDTCKPNVVVNLAQMAWFLTKTVLEMKKTPISNIESGVTP